MNYIYKKLAMDPNRFHAFVLDPIFEDMISYQRAIGNIYVWSSCLARHPGRHTRSPEAAHILEAGTSHGEVANEVPNEGADLEDGGYGSEDKALELWYS